MNSAHHTIAMPRTQRLQREGSPSIAPDRANKMAGRTNAAQEVPGVACTKYKGRTLD